jgi:hypothetical protein
MYTQTNITGPFSEQSEQYIIGSTAYVNLKGMWRAVNISEQQPWNRSMALDQQRMILESSNVTLVDTETTDGQTVHVLQIEPNETVLRNLLQRQTDTSGFARMTFENVTYRQYVRADTYQIERIDLQMEVRQGDQTGTLSMQMDFEDYGSAVSISLPEEATNSTTL